MSPSIIGNTRSGKITEAILAALCLAGSFLARTPAVAQPVPGSATLPQGGVVTRGQVSLQNAGSASSPILNIDQTSTRAVINWNTFNVGSAATVNFNQPNAQSATLNRVSDLNPSQIFGHINAPGQVTLINPAGIYFSSSAVLDVGALTATSMQQSDADFMAGDASFTRNGASGSVINEGMLTAGLGGYIALLAPEVRNQGTIIARQGSVVLAAGEAIHLIFDPSSRLANLTVTPSQIAALVENKTAVRAPDGLIILSATAVDRLMGNVINSGQLNASSLTAKGGRIVLEGDAISLTKTSRISADGATAGGEVLIGGDRQGAGAMHQATNVTMADTATIDASATAVGNGGKIVLWSDVHNLAGQTTVAGQITARGAGAGAVGGQVETSGHRLALADSASVALGKGGQWLLDPANVTLSNGADSNHDVSFVPDSSAATAVVNITTLLTALNAGTDVTVTTTNAGTAGAGAGDLTVSNAITTTGTGAGGLTLNAARDLFLNANITLTGTGKALTFIAGNDIDQANNVAITTAGGAVTYNSDRDGNLAGAINLRFNASVTTNGGNITMGGRTDPLTMPSYSSNNFYSGISLDNTNVILNAGGGDINLTGHTEGGNGGVAANWEAQILTTGNGNITITGNGGASGYGVGLDRTSLSVQNGNITILGLTGPSGREAVVSRVGHKIESTGSGTISITGNGGAGVYFGGWGQTFFIGGASATGNISITADVLTFSDTDATVMSTGSLTLKPYTPGATIGIGNGGAGTVEILSSYFTTNFVDGFSKITVGDSASGNVTVDGVTEVSDSLHVITGGNITINASSSIDTSQAGGTLALAAGGDFINNGGASAVSTTDAGATDRWVVYSSTPASNTFDSLVSGNSAVWGQTFGSQAPASVASGNRYVFAAPGSVTIATTNATKTYGATANVSGNITYTGLPLSGATYGNVYASSTIGDMLSTLPTVSSSGTAASAGVAGGPYAIMASGAVANSGYTFSYTNTGTLTVNPAHLTVTADNQNRLYGAANPSLTTTLNGFVNGEVLGTSGVTGSGSATTTATTSTGVGPAVITAATSTLSASNYDFTPVDGVLTIGRAHLTVTADNQSRLYGAANPTLTTTLSGFVNGETLGTSGVTGSGSATTTATTSTNAGTATITAGPGTLAAGNYDFTTLVNGALVIGKAGLTITANNASKVYDGSPYAGGNGVAYTGFVNGEGSGVLGGVLSYSGSSQGAINAGNYVIAPAGLTSGNYTLNFVNGALTVSPASLSAIIGSLTGITSKVYDGTTTATLTPGNYLLTGFAGSDGVTVTKTSGAFDTPHAGTEKLVTVNLSSGDYAVTGTTLLSNYALPTSITGSIGTITPKPVRLTAPAVSKIYDGNANANAGVTAGLLSDLRSQLGVTGDSVTGIALTFDNKNAGSGKTLNASSATISDGNNGNNYVITYASNNTSTIARLSSVTWIGGATGNWFDAANWAGGAVPDLSNVARVVIPAGVSVTFGSAAVAPAQSGTVHLESLGAQGGLVVTGGELDIGTGGLDLASLRQSGGAVASQGAARFASFEQTGGVFSAAGNFDATSQFNQSGAGGLSVGGTTTIVRSQGDVALGNLNGVGALTVTNTGGAVIQSQGTALTLQGPSLFAASNQGSGTAVTLDQAGNHFGGAVSASGADIALTDMKALTLGTVTSSSRLVVTSNGALNLGRSTVGGDLSARSGNGAITQTGLLQVAGRTDLRSGTGSVMLSDPQNSFGSPVTVSGNEVIILNPLADAMAQRYEKLRANDVFFSDAILPRNRFKIEDIDAVFANDPDGATNISNHASVLLLVRGAQL